MPYADVSGTRLWYEDSGTGPAVVFLHSGLQDARQWDRQVDPFSARRRVVRYDLRWYGHSQRTPGLFSERDDLGGLLDILRIEQAALVGSSLGGRIAIDFALERPERVSALVLACSGLGGFALDVFTPEQEAAVEAAVAAGDLERSIELELEVWAPLGFEGALGRVARENAHVNGAVDADPARLDPPALGRLGELHVPALVITGGRDVPRMGEIGALLESGIAGARRVRLPGSDHFPNLREPDEFNRVVLAFLASLPS